MKNYTATAINAKTHVTRYYSVTAKDMRSAIAAAKIALGKGEILQYVDENTTLRSEGESSEMIGWLKQ